MSNLVGLTGNQVRALRDHLGEGQLVFGRRIAVSQGVIHRLERNAETVVSPETLLLRRMAPELGFVFGGEE